MKSLVQAALFLAVFVFFLSSTTDTHKYITTKLLRTDGQLPAEAYCPLSTSEHHVPTIVFKAGSNSTIDEERTQFLPNASFVPRQGLHFVQTPFNLTGNATARQCPPVVHVKSSPRLDAASFNVTSRNIMSGMSTLPERVRWNIPVWKHWLESAPPIEKVFNASAQDRNALQQLVILAPPSKKLKRDILEIDALTESLGLNIKMYGFEAPRYEIRYFHMIQELWKAALEREKQGYEEIKWFALMDDDTFFPDMAATLRLLESFDHTTDVMLGAMSESRSQVDIWGTITYGGAGVFFSRSLMAKMNAPGMFQSCVAKFSDHFGGDSMVSHCAAHAIKTDLESIFTKEPTLHQLDFTGDVTGWFQSGFRLTSMHHWGSWYTLFPPGYYEDQRDAINLIGNVAGAIGGDNFGRRYVFDDGHIVVSLGYSVSIFKNPQVPAELAKSEHTWNGHPTFHPTRPRIPEPEEKTTYYISSMRVIDRDVYKLIFVSDDFERVDIVWDARDPEPESLVKSLFKRN